MELTKAQDELKKCKLDLNHEIEARRVLQVKLDELDKEGEVKVSRFQHHSTNSLTRRRIADHTLLLSLTQARTDIS